MSQSWPSDVLAFHRLLCPEQIGTTPAFLQGETLSLRLVLIEEEYGEWADAVADRDLPGIADAMADLIYVILGTAVAMGIDMDGVWREVHSANMRKISGERRADGKRMKPPGFVPPDIEGVLARQGPLDAGGGS